MRVLLVSTNQIRPAGGIEWLPVAPLGLAYIAGALRAAGHEIELVDLCFRNDPGAAVREACGRFLPDVVGVSFRNVELMAYFNNVSFLDDLAQVVRICRERSGCRVVVGGSGFSTMPEEILRATGADLGIVGEGEWSFPEVLDRMARGLPVGDVPGVAMFEEGRFRRVPPAWRPDLAELPLPARDLIDERGYIAAGGSANIQTKRGCSFGCIYCTYPVIEGGTERLRPPREVAAEFRALAERGIRKAYIVDSQFNHPMEHAKSVCEEMLETKAGGAVRWSCMLNPRALDRELALMLRLARCAWADLGIDSASESQLERLGKGFTVDDVARTVKLLDEFRIPYGAWILLGGPGESAETVTETLERLEELRVGDVVFGIGLRVCPGTPLERIAREEGIIGPGRSMLESPFYLSMDAGEIVDLVMPYCRAHQGWRIAAYAG